MYRDAALVDCPEFKFDFLQASHSNEPRKVEQEYSVTQLFERDDDCDLLPSWKRQLHGISPWVHRMSVLLSVMAFWTRVSLLAAGPFLWIPWIQLAAERSIMLTRYIDDIWRLTVTKPRTCPRLRLQGDHVPSVDVIITTCGEHQELILDTVRAACHLNYPRDRYRVIVSDDAGNDQLRKQVFKLRKKYSHLLYFAQTHVPGVHSGFKSGNVHATMRFLASLEAHTPDLYTILDVDMIPEPDLLRALTVPLVTDPRVAMAIAPQYFYNQPMNDPLWQSQIAQNAVDEVLRDPMGATWCTGSGFIIRPEALADIGGFSETSLAEDVLSSLMLHGKGRKTVYINEKLQWGLVPEDFAAHINQRTRWNIGTMHNSLQLACCLGGSLTKDMTFHQRLSGFVYCTNAWTSTIIRVLALVVFPFCLWSGESVLGPMSASNIRMLLRFEIAESLVGRIYEYLASLEAGYFVCRRHAEGTTWLTPYLTFTMLRELIPAAWGGKRMGFTPSATLKSTLRERDRDARAPLWTRIKVMMYELGVGFYVGALLVIFTATITSLLWTARIEQNLQSFCRAAFLRALWSGMPWAQYAAFFTPIVYMIWPSTVLPRRELMTRDPKTGIWRPKLSSRGERSDRSIFVLLITPALTPLLQTMTYVAFIE